MTAQEAIPELLSALQVGEAASVVNLALFPLIATGTANAGGPDYLLYQQAHDMGLVSIEEIDEAGVVNGLRVGNAAGQPVLLVEGEVLLGMKQTRVLNVSVLVPAEATLEVPVSCVEAGRWHSISARAIGKADVNLPPRVRAAKAASVGRSVRSEAAYRSDQGEVWNKVDEILEGHRVESPTRSYQDLSGEVGDEIARVADDVRPVTGQLGVVACIDGSPVCADVFEKPSVVEALWRGLVASYQADAVVSGSRAKRPPASSSVEAWLFQLNRSTLVPAPELGLGSHVSCVGTSIEAAALVHEGRVLHLSAFPRGQVRRQASFASPSRRRA